MRSIAFVVLALWGCREQVSEPGPSTTPAPPSAAGVVSSTPSAAASTPTPIPSAAFSSVPPASVAPAPDDPLRGKFGLAQATAGLRGEGTLYAVMRTTAGNLVCELFEDKAPNTVANFVGLARGLRPYKKDGKWLKRPLYDGSELYSVIKNFAIEGGSPGEKYNDELGYFIADEIWDGARHDQRGLLCMRAFTPGRSGSQFMILDGAATQLDQSFTIFGKCEVNEAFERISQAPVEAARPKPAITLRKLEIVRGAKPPT
jgi:peptidyl-prolyl cis-trans isomerase A (cyclophilin A)